MLSTEKNINGKVLVLGDDDRSFLTVIRSLGRKNIYVDVGWCPPSSFALHSKYIKKVHDIPPFSFQNNLWKESLISLFQQENYDLVIPCNDKTMIPLQVYSTELEKFGNLYLINDRAFKITQDKIKTYELAKSNNIPVPRSIIINFGSDISKILKDFTFPVVIKPRFSLSYSDLDNKNFVRKIYSEDELRNYIKYILKDNQEVQVQENFIGTGIGIEVLVEQGNILVAFQHNRVHEPLMGGGSTYRKSAAPHPELLDATKKLMKDLNYTGVGMAEFKVNFETNQWIFLEINGRFWGSLPLAVSSGVDFPYYLYQLLVHKKRNFPQDYKKGIYCRSFLFDLDWLKKNFHADKSDKTLATLPNHKVATELFNILSFKEKSDVFVIDDLGPGLAELGFLFNNLFSSFRDNLILRQLNISSVKNKEIKKVQDSIKNTKNILFVCKGNICRSPFAKKYIQTILPDTIEVLSCGYDTIDGRFSPPEATAAAKKYGIDLSKHQSTSINENLVKNAQAIYVFDEKSRNIVLSRFHSAKNKIYRLALLAEKSIPIIEDPFGGTLKTFFKTYEEIVNALNNIFKTNGNG